MKLHQLLEETILVGPAVKAISNECKEIAAKFQLTLVAGMGWPNIVKDGGWMGGGLGARRGISDKDADLSIEKRRIGFIKALAKKLEGYLAEGRVVKIGRGASRSVHQELAVAGKVEQQLLNNLEDDYPPGTNVRNSMPCVLWFVGMPPGVKSLTYASIDCSINTDVNSVLSGVKVAAWSSAGFYTNVAVGDADKPLLSFLRKMSNEKPDSLKLFGFVADLVQYAHSTGQRHHNDVRLQKSATTIGAKKFIDLARAEMVDRKTESPYHKGRSTVSVNLSLGTNKVLGAKAGEPLEIEVLRRIAAQHGYKDKQ